MQFLCFFFAPEYEILKYVEKEERKFFTPCYSVLVQILKKGGRTTISLENLKVLIRQLHICHAVDIRNRYNCSVGSFSLSFFFHRVRWLAPAFFLLWLRSLEPTLFCSLKANELRNHRFAN
jgi:hypothetical protein